MNLGDNKFNVNRSNNAYLIGFYFFNAVLNLNKTTINLKKNINFVIKSAKKNKKINFFVINDNNNKILIKNYVTVYSSAYVSFYNGSWWNGLLKSFKKYIKYKTKKTKKFKFFKNQYPFLVFFINKQKYDETSDNTSFISKELNSIPILNVFFCGLNTSCQINPNAIYQNVKTTVNNFFLNRFTLRIIKKSNQINKKLFLITAFKKFKLNKNKFIFFEYKFLTKNKKNFLVKNEMMI